MDREPLDSKYCKEVKCPSLHGNKCTEENCVRTGCEKRTLYFMEHGHLADGDTPNA